jgi:hypothetical protein
MGILEGWLNDDLARMAAAPFALALALALVVRLLGGADLGRRLAALGIGAGVLAAIYLISGLAPFPPAATNQKLIYAIAAGWALGIVLDLAGLTRAGGHLFALLLPLGVLWWLRETQLRAGPGTELVVSLVILYLVSVLVYWRQAASARGADAPAASSAALFPAIQLLAAGAGLGSVRVLDVPASLGMYGVAVAAAAGGYLLVAYLWHAASGRGLGFGAAGALGGGGAWLAILYAAAFQTDESVKRVLLALVAATFVADFFARPLALGAPLGTGLAARLLRPLVYGIVVSIPSAAAFAYAWFGLGMRLG